MSLANHHEDPRSAWWNPWNWPAGIWVLLIGAFLFALPFGIRAVMLAGIPDMAEPFDIDEFFKWDVPAEEDAFTFYRQAADLQARLWADLKSQGGPTPQEPADHTVVLDQGWSEADESTKKWLELHRESLTVWRRGTEKPQGRNLSPADVAIDTLLEVIQQMRLFVRLAMYEEARLISAGELDKARQWARAAYRSGGHVGHRGCLIQGLVGVAIHAQSCNGLARWAEQPEVTSEQLKKALAEIKSDYALYDSRSNIMKAEYLAMRNTFMSAKWAQMIAPMDPGQAGASVPMKMGYWVIGEPELTMRIFRQMLANQIQEIDKPLSTRRKTVGTGASLLFEPDPTVPLLPGQLDPAGIDRGIKRSILIRMLAPSLKSYDNAMLRQASKQAAMEILLAAQAYRRDHGEFPEDLSQLVPNYLAAVPLDPCDPAGGPLRYRCDEVLKAVVWSVGYDRIDGGGDVESANSQPADVGFVIKSAE